MADSKTFKQDMVVSIRYRNDLPPPPMPPKFLDIDTGGLAQYLTTGYASSLVKREEPNIEVDAEGGMPIDMIGVPGYFIGDESAIMAPEIQPVLDPADAALMMSLDQLKSQGAKNNVSFLRKSQYMTSSQTARVNDPFVRNTPRAQKTQPMKTPPAPVSRDDPENIRRQVQKGFDLAYPDSVAFNPPGAKANLISKQEQAAWEAPKHPDNPRLQPVEFYPIIPDLESGTDLNCNWQALKFDKPPLAPLKNGRRDDRIDTALLYAIDDPDLLPQWQVKKDAYDANPAEYLDPGPQPRIWSLFAPKHGPDAAAVVTPGIKQLLDDSNPGKDAEDMRGFFLEESTDGSRRLPFERIRVYPKGEQYVTNNRKTMALSLVDPKNLDQSSRLRKQGRAAYYYPILDRLKMKADRGNLSKTRRRAEEEPKWEEEMPDQIMVAFREPSARERYYRNYFRQNEPGFADQWAEIEREAQAEEEADRAAQALEEQGEVSQGQGDVNMEEVEAAEDAEAGRSNGGDAVERQDRDDHPSSLPERNRNGHVDADADAEGEEDEAMRDD